MEMPSALLQEEPLAAPQVAVDEDSLQAGSASTVPL
jgi:hypothetical protein